MWSFPLCFPLFVWFPVRVLQHRKTFLTSFCRLAYRTAALRYKRGPLCCCFWFSKWKEGGKVSVMFIKNCDSESNFIISHDESQRHKGLQMTACDTSCWSQRPKTTKSISNPAFLRCLEIISHKVAVAAKSCRSGCCDKSHWKKTWCGIVSLSF